MKLIKFLKLLKKKEIKKLFLIKLVFWKKFFLF